MIDERSDVQRRAIALVSDLQEQICAAVVALEQAGAGDREPAAFLVDAWDSEADPLSIHGGGSTRVIADGAVFEKGGVNTSVVTGTRLPPSVVAQRPELAGHGFFAAGVSVVLHPWNPYAPTAHCNFRYF
jgi:coproporphyrinogen III oxidase